MEYNASPIGENVPDLTKATGMFRNPESTARKLAEIEKKSPALYDWAKRVVYSSPKIHEKYSRDLKEGVRSRFNKEMDEALPDILGGRKHEAKRPAGGGILNRVGCLVGYLGL